MKAAHHQLVKNYTLALNSETLQWKNSSINTLVESAKKNFKFPEKKTENWKHAEPAKEMLKEIQSPISSGILSDKPLNEGPILAIINGKYSQKYSRLPDDINVSLYSHQDTDIPHEYLQLLKMGLPNPFESLNMGLMQEILSITIPAPYSSSLPLNILHMINSPLATVCPRIILKVEENARSPVVEIFESSIDEKYQQFAVTHILLQKNAKLNYTKIQNENPVSFHYGKLTATLLKNASLKLFSLSLGAVFGSNNILVHLDEEDAQTEIFGLFKPRGEKTDNEFCQTHHKASHTTGLQLFKGILNDESHGIFTGKIIVEKDAQKVDSSQLSKNLLLSKKARVITEPILEVHADDIKCSHGATVGNLNQDELFYLKARGIPENKARQMLAKAFIHDIIEKQDNPLVKKLMTSRLLAKDTGEDNDT